MDSEMVDIEVQGDIGNLLREMLGMEQTLAAVVFAAGGRVSLLPQHLAEAGRLVLTRWDDPTKNSVEFRAALAPNPPAGKSGDDDGESCA